MYALRLREIAGFTILMGMQFLCCRQVYREKEKKCINWHITFINTIFHYNRYLAISYDFVLTRNSVFYVLKDMFPIG